MGKPKRPTILFQRCQRDQHSASVEHAPPAPLLRSEECSRPHAEPPTSESGPGSVATDPTPKGIALL
eukprot:11294885-Alexandrium_andersonii.AAC.1